MKLKKLSCSEYCGLLFDRHSDAVLILNPEGTMLFANEAASALFGYPREEWLHKPYEDVIRSDEMGTLRHYMDKAAKGETNEFELKATAGRNRKAKLRLTTVPIKYRGRLISISVYIKELNERNKRKPKSPSGEQLERMAAEYGLTGELGKLEHMRTASHLAASISHEIRNPLTVTRGFIQLLKDPGLTEEKKRVYIQMSLDELDRAEHIITDYLSFAKPSADSSERIAVNKELDYIVQVIHPYASMQNIEMNMIKNERDVYIYGDSKKFHQSLINIVKNGIEAMEHKGELTIRLSETKEKAIIVVKDTGKGMTPEQLKKLGTPFFTTKETGTGLGTLVAFNFIREMKGEIDLESKAGKGTSITITLPKLANGAA